MPDGSENDDSVTTPKVVRRARGRPKKLQQHAAKMNLPSIASFFERLTVPESVSDGQVVITDTTEVMEQVNYFAL